VKIRVLDRILVAFAGLLVLAGCAALAAQLFFNADVAGWAAKLLADESSRVWLIAVLALLIVLGVYCLLILFRHHGRKEKFIMQKTENGELAISLKALESMVQKCLDPHKELSVQAVKLENQKGGLLVRIRGTVAGGVSIPLTVDALQVQIKQYVTACSGVEVKDIRVLIESSGPEAPGSLFAIEPPSARALPGGESAEEKPGEQAAENTEGSSGEAAEKAAAAESAPGSPDAEGAAAKVEVSAAAAAAAEQLKNETPPEEDDRPIHQRLFSSPDQPCVMPMPPETEAPAQETAGDEAAPAREEKTEDVKEMKNETAGQPEAGQAEGKKEAEEQPEAGRAEVKTGTEGQPEANRAEGSEG